MKRIRRTQNYPMSMKREPRPNRESSELGRVIALCLILTIFLTYDFYIVYAVAEARHCIATLNPEFFFLIGFGLFINPASVYVIKVFSTPARKFLASTNATVWVLAVVIIIGGIYGILVMALMAGHACST